MKKLFIIIASIFFIVPVLHSKNNIVPDDYQTIQSAIDASEAGDTVLVNPGSYHEFLVIKDSVVVMSSGQEDLEWTRAYNTIIHSDGLRDEENNIPPVVDMGDGSVLDGFEITGMDTVNHHLPGHSHAVQNRGKSGIIKFCVVHHNGSTGIGSHEKEGNLAHPTIFYNKVHNNYGIGIGFNHFSKGSAADNEVFENREVGIGIQNGARPLIELNRVYNNGWNGISAREGAAPIIRGNMVYSNGIDPTGEGAPENTGVGIGADSTGWMVKDGEEFDYVTIEGNIVYDNPSGGVMCRNMARAFIKMNEIKNNNNFQIAVNASGAAIDSNMIYNDEDSQYEGRGVVVTKSSQVDFTHNYLSGSSISGLVISDNATANVGRNEIYNNSQAGIRLENSVNMSEFKYNKISGNLDPGIVIENAVAIVHHNEMEYNAKGGISLVDGNLDVHIFNNTIIGEEGADGRGINALSNTTVKNNIIVGYKLGVFKDGDDEIEIDYNCTYLNQGYNGPPGTGGEHALETYPEFVDAENSDYHLLETSPCINTGDPDEAFNDPDGTRSDIGCYYFDVASSVEWRKENLKELNIYPTIAKDKILIDLSAKCEIEIFDSRGNKVSNYIINGQEINISNLSQGIYFIKAISENVNYFGRFVKLK